MAQQQNHLFTISPMNLGHVAAAVSLEQQAYIDTPPQRNYLHELQHNPIAHYFVLQPASKSLTIGVGGIWLIAHQSNIMTIAIHPKWQRLGLGQWLLLNLIEKSQQLNAETATLEVRPSNTTAITLYKKYGFQEVGHRTSYYKNGEDALILTTPPISSPDYQLLLAKQKQTLLQQLAQIEIDKINQTD